MKMICAVLLAVWTASSGAGENRQGGCLRPDGQSDARTMVVRAVRSAHGNGGGTVVRTDGQPAAFQMTLKPSEEGIVLVNYRVDGVDCTYGGDVDIPIVGSKSVSDVVLGGNGTVRSLFALAEPSQRGLIFVVR